MGTEWEDPKGQKTHRKSCSQEGDGRGVHGGVIQQTRTSAFEPFLQSLIYMGALGAHAGRGGDARRLRPPSHAQVPVSPLPRFYELILGFSSEECAHSNSNQQVVHV